MTGVEAEATMTGAAAKAGAGAVVLATLNTAVLAAIPWLITMWAVVVCDMAMAMWRCIKTGERIRLSRGVRETMAKIVIYTAFVMTVALFETAMGGGLNPVKWTCATIALIEGVSIANNFLKPKGIEIDLRAVLAFLGERLGKGLGKAVKNTNEKE